MYQRFKEGKKRKNKVKRKERHLNWKGRSKLSLFEDDIILYIENPKESTHTQKTIRVNK